MNVIWKRVYTWRVKSGIQSLVISIDCNRDSEVYMEGLSLCERPKYFWYFQSHNFSSLCSIACKMPSALRCPALFTQPPGAWAGALLIRVHESNSDMFWVVFSPNPVTPSWIDRASMGLWSLLLSSNKYNNGHFQQMLREITTERLNALPIHTYANK